MRSNIAARAQALRERQAAQRAGLMVGGLGAQEDAKQRSLSARGAVLGFVEGAEGREAGGGGVEREELQDSEDLADTSAGDSGEGETSGAFQSVHLGVGDTEDSELEDTEEESDVEEGQNGGEGVEYGRVESGGRSVGSLRASARVRNGAGQFVVEGREDSSPVSEEVEAEERAMSEREARLSLKERELAAEQLRLDQRGREEELHLRQSARNMGLGLSIPALKLAQTLSEVADEIGRKVRSNIQGMTVRDLKSIAEMTVNVADKTSRIVRNAFDMEREARGSLPSGMRQEEYGSPEEALEALEELAQTVERYGEGVVIEDEFPGSDSGGGMS